MRLFLATPLPPAITGALEKLTQAVKRGLPASSWVRAEAMHLTYAFLGEHEEHVLETIATHVRSHLAALPQLEARLLGCGFFPDERRPRVAWLGLLPAESFSLLGAGVRSGLREAGVSFDEKPFRPHLTVARMKEAWREKDAELFCRAFAEFESEPFAVTHVSLYSSHLAARGAQYTELVRFELVRERATD